LLDFAKGASVTLLHGDFGAPNFLLSVESGSVMLLDFAEINVGSPAEELASFLLRASIWHDKDDASPRCLHGFSWSEATGKRREYSAECTGPLLMHYHKSLVEHAVDANKYPLPLLMDGVVVRTILVLLGDSKPGDSDEEIMGKYESFLGMLGELTHR